MASGLVFRVCLLTPLASVVTANTLHRGDGIVRRQMSGVVQAQLGADGEVDLHQEEPAQSTQAMLKMQQPGETMYCDETFPRGTANSNDCGEGANPIYRQEDCRHAATTLGLTMASGSEWLINDDWVNPDSYPKNCFFDDAKQQVRFNPMNSNNTGGYTGQPICELVIYKNGTGGVDSDAGCTGEYEPITTWAECEWAHDCQWGGLYCQETSFANDHYTTQDAPRGCYRNAIGCYGFNAVATAPSGDLTQHTPVCRLKTYVFTPRTATHNATA